MQMWHTLPGPPVGIGMDSLSGEARLRFSRVLRAAMALALTAQAAGAATYYVSPSGSATNAGTSAAAPWTMAKANATLAAGDVCIVQPGTYSTSISPVNGGSSITRRITYVGNLANPAAAVVPSIQPATSYVTVKGVSASGAIIVSYPGTYDSVTTCISSGLAFYAGKYSVVAHNTINGEVAFLANSGLPCYSNNTLDARCFANSEYDTLRANRIAIGIMGPGYRSFEFKAWTQYCLIDSNYVTGTFWDNNSTDTNNGIALVSYNSYHQTFRDNRWEFEAINNHHLYPNTHWDAMYFRDSLNTTTFERDTVLAGIQSPAGIEIRCMMASSGTYPQSITNITFSHCILRTTGDIIWQDSFNHWTFDHCVLQSLGGNPFYVLSDWNSSQLDHCTIWSTGQALRMEGPSGGQHMLGTGNAVTSSIFYSPTAGPLGNYGGIVMWRDNTTNFTSNNNLYFTPTYTSSPGDLSIIWNAYYGSKPGVGQNWYKTSGQDGASKAASPLFVDSTATTFDASLRTGSPAIGMAADGTDAGAVPFAVAATDVTPPSAVSDLAASGITGTGLTLSWTAPGDDGASGTATYYDLRYSTSPITAANFAGCAQLLPSPSPLVGGTIQTYTVSALSPSVKYYFAIKARDDAGNWGAISNLPQATTLDTIPPAAVKDLTPTLP